METKAQTELQKAVLSLVRERQKSFNLITVGELKTILKKPMNKIVEAAEDMDLCVNVGIKTNNGHGNIAKRDWSIEDLDYPYAD